MANRITGPQGFSVTRAYDASVDFIPLYPRDFAFYSLTGAASRCSEYCFHVLSFYTRSTLELLEDPVRLEMPATQTLTGENIFNSTDIQLSAGVDGETIALDVAAGGSYTFWGSNVSVGLLIPTPPSFVGLPGFPDGPPFYIGNSSQSREIYENVVLPASVIQVNDYIAYTLSTCSHGNISRKPRLTRNYRADLTEQDSQGPNVFRIPSRASQVTFYTNNIMVPLDAIEFSRDGQYFARNNFLSLVTSQDVVVPGDARYFRLALEDTDAIVKAVWELDL